jgi:flagellar biosynthesis protein
MNSRKIFQAFALELSEEDEAPPKLSARGEYELAQHIVACARRHNIPIVERPELCSALEALEVDEQIPPDLFKAAAIILAEVGALGKRGSKPGGSDQ